MTPNDDLAKAFIADYTGTDVEADQGLVVQYNEPMEVAADGTSVVSLYFQRRYFLVAFNIGDGAIGTKAIYAKYDAPMTIDDPTRSGFNFTGWSNESGVPFTQGSGKLNFNVPAIPLTCVCGSLWAASPC